MRSGAQTERERIRSVVRHTVMTLLTLTSHQPVRRALLRVLGTGSVAAGVIAVMVAALGAGAARVDARNNAPGSSAIATALPSGGVAVYGGSPSPAPSSAPTSVATSGLLTRAQAVAKAPPPLGDTVTRLEAKLVLRTDLAAAGNGIGGIRPHVDYIWVVARWGQFTRGSFGAPLFRDKQQPPPPPPPEGWRFVLIDARTGDPYVGGGSVAEGAWWIGLPDRSGDPIR